MEEKNHVFYVDKTHFIREWWESGADYAPPALWEDADT